MQRRWLLGMHAGQQVRFADVACCLACVPHTCVLLLSARATCKQQHSLYQKTEMQMLARVWHSDQQLAVPTPSLHYASGAIAQLPATVTRDQLHSLRASADQKVTQHHGAVSWHSSCCCCCLWRTLPCSCEAVNASGCAEACTTVWRKGKLHCHPLRCGKIAAILITR